MKRETKGKILVVDDEEDIVKTLTKRLMVAGYEVVSARNGSEGLLKAKELAPDLILLDVMMPKMGGMETKLKLNEDAVTAGIPVVFLTARGLPYSKVAGLRLGAEDYMTKPFEADELFARIESAIQRRRTYEKIALTDPLTGLANMGMFKKQFSVFFHLAKRHRCAFSLAILDVDNLKRINDQHGHQAGDAILKSVASAMKKVFRRSDVLIRYGGDEFVVLMPEMPEDKARLALNRLLDEVGFEVIVTGFPHPVVYSLSVGLASYQEGFANEEELFALADQRMYEEKASRKVKLQIGS